MLNLSTSIWKVILGFSLFRLVLALILPLTPQEAYYWSWSRDLSLSYFDHPPLASYSIWLTTLIFGHTIFGVKLAAVLWYLGFYVFVAKLVQEMFENEDLTFWVLIALNASIVFELYGFVITPDSPLIFAWAATIFSIWRLVHSGEAKWWYLAGFFMGLSWLGKYSGIMLVPSILMFVLISKEQRKWLLSPHPYLASLLSVVVFSPVLIWNVQHDWISFAFQGTRRTSGMGQWEPRFFLELLGSQLFILTPYLLVLVVAAYIRFGKKIFGAMEDKILLLFSSGFITISFFTLVSFRSLVKMNWLAPAYWSFVILGMYYLIQDPKRFKRVKIGIFSSFLFLALGVSVVTIPNIPLGEGNTWSGWKQTAGEISALSDSLDQAGESHFVYSTNYKASSLLKFYMEDQPRTYAQNIIGKHALQFDLWEGESDLIGQTGILAVDDRKEYRFKAKRIIPYFDEVTKYNRILIRNFNQDVRTIDIYLCKGYRGPEGEASE